MSDSDDDMPPPLEDMSAQIAASQAKKGKPQSAAMATPEDEGEEIRLVPRKKPEVAAAGVAGAPKANTRIAPSETSNAAKKGPMIQEIDPPKTTPVSQASAAAQQSATTQQPAAKPKKSSGGFGGFKAGFLLGGGGPKKAKKPAAAAQQPKPTQAPVIEDHTHVKAKDPNANLRFEEVQNNLKTGLEQTKNEWLTPQFLEKLMASPRLSAAFSNPETMQILQEMGSKPDETMQKYGNNPEFKELLLEFSALTGTHFTEIADKKKKEEEKKMQDDPVMQTINTDPEVKQILEDPKVMNVIHMLQKGGGLDFNEVVRKDPVTGNKLFQLIQKGVLNTQSTPPSGGALP